MDSIDSTDFSPINFHTAMETPNRPCEEKAPLLAPRTSTPYSYLRKKVFKPVADEQPKALCGTVSSSNFLVIIVVLKLLGLAVLAQQSLYHSRINYKAEPLQIVSVVCVVAVPVLLLALVAIRTGRSILLMPYLLLQVALNLLFTVTVAAGIHDYKFITYSQNERVVPFLTALLIPYAFWSYITFIALRQVFAMRAAQKLLKLNKMRDVERPTTDEEEDVIVFERPRPTTGRKVRFAGLLGRKEH